MGFLPQLKLDGMHQKIWRIFESLELFIGEESPLDPIPGFLDLLEFFLDLRCLERGIAWRAGGLGRGVPLVIHLLSRTPCFAPYQDDMNAKVYVAMYHAKTRALIQPHMGFNSKKTFTCNLKI